MEVKIYVEEGNIPKPTVKSMGDGKYFIMEQGVHEADALYRTLLPDELRLISHNAEGVRPVFIIKTHQPHALADGFIHARGLCLISEELEVVPCKVIEAKFTVETWG